ncbi:hypothetical protein T459_07720 [Capsicum annuum]|uniref:TF-B3 domain-containing protein n=1 Tax=Capsicum annuum TaxID=4072 RepID=A0A2G2ZUF5_CAPAN|nr:hypothetical protein T459_07720 [Capsicum annuum]
MKSNGLMDESEMILVNEKQRSWREFCIMNCLKEGDRLMFEIVSNGETPMFIFHGSPSIQANEVKMKKLDAERMSDKGLRLKNSSTTTPESQLDASTYVYVNCHFISTIKPYTIKNPTLEYLPLDFVKSNGLMDESEMILVNEKQRSWREFCIMNCLKEGDRLMFEIVSNGETPMFIFHGSPSIQANEVKMKKLDAERMSDKGLRLKNSSTTTPESQLDASTYVYVNCHFISTIKPYTIKNPTLV